MVDDMLDGTLPQSAPDDSGAEMLLLNKDDSGAEVLLLKKDSGPRDGDGAADFDSDLIVVWIFSVLSMAAMRDGGITFGRLPRDDLIDYLLVIGGSLLESFLAPLSLTSAWAAACVGGPVAVDSPR